MRARQVCPHKTCCQDYQIDMMVWCIFERFFFPLVETMSNVFFFLFYKTETMCTNDGLNECGMALVEIYWEPNNRKTRKKKYNSVIQRTGSHENQKVRDR